MSEPELVAVPVNLEKSPLLTAVPELVTPAEMTVTPSQADPEKVGNHKLRRALGYAAIGAVEAYAGLTLATNIATIPADIHTGVPGISAQARVQHAAFSGLELGPTTLGAPNAHARILGQDFGVIVNVKNVDTHNSIDKKQTLAALVQDPKSTLGPEVESALEWQAAWGLAAGVGLIVGSEGGRWRLRQRRRKRLAEEVAEEDEQQEDAEQHIALAKDVQAQLPEGMIEKKHAKLAALEQKRQKRHEHKRAPKLRVAAINLGAVALSTLFIAHEVDVLSPSPGSRAPILTASQLRNPTAQDILADAPVLKGAFMTGDFGYVVKRAAAGVLTYVGKTDDYFKGQAEYLTTTAIPELKAAGGMDWLNDPNIVSIAQITDVHDNRPYIQYFLPTALKALGVDIVANTGDQENFSEKLFLDNGSTDREASVLPKKGRSGKPVVEVKSAGNHDRIDSKNAHKLTFKTPDGTTYHPIIPLDSKDGYTTIIDGVTFVGSPDLNRTTTQTIPSDIPGQMANDAKQGTLLADKACDIYEKTGQKPILMGHEQQSTYEAIARGCVQLAISGHLHENKPVHAYLNSDGSITYQQTLGSASGDGANNVAAIYNRPTTVASMEIYFKNKVTGELLNHTIILHLNPNGGLSLEDTPLPSATDAVPAIANPAVKSFLDTYDPGLQAKIEAQKLEVQKLAAGQKKPLVAAGGR